MGARAWDGLSRLANLIDRGELFGEMTRDGRLLFVNRPALPVSPANTQSK
jgi:hypothetical protein